MHLKERTDFRLERPLRKCIAKIFADGIRNGDTEQTAVSRRHAYCLSLGLTEEYLQNVAKPAYESLLQQSLARYTVHKMRIDAFRAEHGREKRLPLDNCCEDHTPMCRVLRQIRKDVPRTSSTFSVPSFDLPIHTGENPIFNVLVAYAEVDKDLGYT